MEIVKILILILVFIIVIPLNFKISISYDFVSNIGKIYFKLFKINIVYVRFFIKNKNLNLVNKNLKKIEIPLTSNEDLKNYADLNLIIFRKLDVKHLETHLKFGIKDNPFASTMILGVYDFLIKKILNAIKYFKNRAKLVNNIDCYYQNNLLIFNLNSSVSISIIDYLWGILESKVFELKMGEKLKWQKMN